MIPEGGQVLLPYPHPEQQLRQVHTITDRFSIANTYLINGERLVGRTGFATLSTP